MNKSKYEILIENISPNVTKKHLEEIFGFFGTISDIRIKPFTKNYCRLTAYVAFGSCDDAENARKGMNGGQIDGMTLRVSIVEDDKEIKKDNDDNGDDKKNCVLSRSRSRSNSSESNSKNNDYNSSSYSSLSSPSH